MTETKSKIGFWQFPLSLKLTVTLIFLASLSCFLTPISVIGYDDLILGLVFFSLAVGLIEKRNSSRIWVSIWMICETLLRFYSLWRVILYGVGSEANFTFLSAKYPITNLQTILFLIFNIAINISVLYILLRPSTKALFSPPPAPLSKPSIPDNSAQA